MADDDTGADASGPAADYAGRLTAWEAALSAWLGRVQRLLDEP